MTFAKFLLCLLTCSVILAQDYPGLKKLVCGAGECPTYKDYYASKLKLSWFQAWAACQDYGLDFVSLDSKTEADSFRNVLTKNAALVDKSIGVFVGLTVGQIGNYSSCVWVATNKPLRFNLTWGAGQPNNIGGVQSCMGLSISTTVGDVYAFNDLECDETRFYPFVCQKVKS